MAALRGVVFRCGIACLPLVAVILLCVMMFSGLGKPKATAANFNVNTALFPRAEASEVESGKQKVVQAAFERMHITHATIRVPD